MERILRAGPRGFMAQEFEVGDSGFGKFGPRAEGEAPVFEIERAAPLERLVKGAGYRNPIWPVGVKKLHLVQ